MASRSAIPEAPVLDTETEADAFRDLTGELEMVAPVSPARVTINVTKCFDGDPDCIEVEVDGATFSGFSMDLSASKKMVRELTAANNFVHEHRQLLGDHEQFDGPIDN